MIDLQTDCERPIHNSIFLKDLFVHGSSSIDHLICSILSARTRSQRKRELEMEVAQLKKQVKHKRKAALNSSGIGGCGGYVNMLWGVRRDGVLVDKDDKNAWRWCV